MIKEYIQSCRRKREPRLDDHNILDLIFALAMSAEVTPAKFATAFNRKKIVEYARKINKKLKAQMDKEIEKAVKELKKKGIKAKHIKN